MNNKILILLAAIISILGWIYFSFGGPKPISQENIFLRENDGINIVTEGENVGENLSTDHRLPINAVRNLKTLFFGDLMLDRHVKEKIDKYGLEYLLVKLDTDGVFKDQDIIGANLEGAVTNRGVHYLPANSYDFAFAPEVLGNLKKYNFNFFNLANNHLADQGERGIIETRSNLQESGFDFSGCEDGVVDDCSAVVVKKNGLKVGLVGLSMISKKLETNKAEKIISAISTSSDLVIVNIHWGQEYEHNFSRLQQELAHALVAAGADIIIGHHPHVVQGLEIFANKPIFYSLGNFIFDQYFSSETQVELAVEITWTAAGVENPSNSPLLKGAKSLSPPLLKGVNKGKMEITLRPMRSVGSQSYLVTGEEKEKFLEKFVNWSKIDENIKKQIEEGKILLSS